MKVSIVSVSRSASPPHPGHVVKRHVGCSLSGLSPVGFHSTASGSSTGSWSVGTAWGPQAAQYTMGMGAPQ